MVSGVLKISIFHISMERCTPYTKNTFIYLEWVPDYFDAK